MADFHTHLNGGIFLSGASVVWLHGVGLAPTGQTLPLFALGVTGSLLPDIDADSSAPVRATFGILGAVLAFAWTLPLAGRFLPLELGMIWATLFLSVRFLLRAAFARFTVHRGIWHSWLGVAFATLATTDLAYWLVREPPRSAWIAGGVLGLGYFSHLCLDEISSVDLASTQVNRAFGTALKPFSLRDPAASLLMGTAVAALAWLAPEADWMGRAPELGNWAYETAALVRSVVANGLAQLHMLLD